ncbi:MAG: hypothetical protein ACPGSM_04035 [Thiolinea sp.]
MDLFKKISLFTLLLLPLLATGISEANVKTATGSLSLMATLDGKPAFRPVIWKLIPRSHGNRSRIKTLTRHSATIDLEPGKYLVSVSMDNKTLSRHITIKESSKQSLVIQMD